MRIFLYVETIQMLRYRVYVWENLSICRKYFGKRLIKRFQKHFADGGNTQVFAPTVSASFLQAYTTPVYRGLNGFMRQINPLKVSILIQLPWFHVWHGAWSLPSKQIFCTTGLLKRP